MPINTANKEIMKSMLSPDSVLWKWIMMLESDKKWVKKTKEKSNNNCNNNQVKVQMVLQISSKFNKKLKLHHQTSNNQTILQNTQVKSWAKNKRENLKYKLKRKRKKVKSKLKNHNKKSIMTKVKIQTQMMRKCKNKNHWQMKCKYSNRNLWIFCKRVHMEKRDLQNWVLTIIWSFFMLLTVWVFISDEKERRKNAWIIFLFIIYRTINLSI